MSGHGTTLADRTPSITPEIRCEHPDDVADVRVLGPHRLWVRFHDGLTGEVDLSRLILSERAGVFAELRELSLFDQASVVLGAVTWPNGLDLAPDTMYTALLHNRTWSPE